MTTTNLGSTGLLDQPVLDRPVVDRFARARMLSARIDTGDVRPSMFERLTPEELWVLAQETDWRSLAACTQTDPEAFFPEPGGQSRASDARKVCAGCEVRALCREWIMRIEQNGYRHGIFGGMTPSERAQLYNANPRRWRPDGLVEGAA